MSSHDDRDLRALLHETAEQVTPHGTLEEIRARTAEPSHRRRFLPALAAAAVVALVVGGIGWVLHDDDPQTSPLGTPSKDATGTEATLTRAVPVYFAGATAHGTRLYREFQNKEVCPTAGCMAMASIQASLAGTAQDPDYRTLWPKGSGVNAVESSSDLIWIELNGDLRARPAGMSAADAELAVQQLVYSAQAAYGQGRVPVQLGLSSGRSDTVLGVPTAEPLAAAPEAEVLAPVQISSPADGATLQAGNVTVEGRASAFEATVVWELMVGGDTVVKHGFGTAAECCVLSPYSFTIDHVAPGTYTIVVHDTDESGEGRPVNSDSKEIVVE